MCECECECECVFVTSSGLALSPPLLVLHQMKTGGRIRTKSAWRLKAAETTAKTSKTHARTLTNKIPCFKPPHQHYHHLRLHHHLLSLLLLLLDLHQRAAVRL